MQPESLGLHGFTLEPFLWRLSHMISHKCRIWKDDLMEGAGRAARGYQSLDKSGERWERVGLVISGRRKD